MAARHSFVGALALILLTAPIASAWTQLHGDAARSGLMPLPETAIDVIRYHKLLPESENFNSLQGPTLVPTRNGFVGVARVIETDACVFVRVDAADLSRVVRTPIDDCHAPWFQGYDPVTDHAFVCGIAQASEPVFQARDATTGTLVWHIAPSRDLDVVDAEAAMYWGCTGAAIDVAKRIAAVIFINAQTGLDVYRHRVALVNLDSGSVMWTTQVSRTSEFTGGVVTGQPVAEGPAAGFIPLTATMTATGILTTGVIVCADILTCDQPSTNEEENFGPFMTATAWMTLDGEVQGMATSRLDRRSDDLDGDATARTAGGAFWATASGSLGAISAGGYITIVNPEDKDWLASAKVSKLESPRWGVDPFASPVWGRESIFVPFYRTVTAFDPVDLRQRWAWATDESGWIIGDTVVSHAGSLLVLATKTPRTTRAGMGLQSNESILVRLDGATGEELQRLPVVAETWMATEEPFGIPESGREDFRYPRPPVILPLEGGLLIVDLSGNAIEIRSADDTQAPRVAIDNAFPAPGDDVTLRIPRDQHAPVEEVHVRWGDGTRDRAGSDTVNEDGTYELTHAFAEPKRHQLLVTTVYADGTTRSTTSVIDVGGTPPPELNALQRAFAPENQDLTFGILGIVLAVSGGLWAAHVRYRRRGWLRRKLDEIGDVAERFRDRPDLMRAALEEQREGIRARALRGELEEAPLSLLEERINVLASAARRDLVESELSFLPYALVRRLQGILRDNKVEEDELSAFLEALQNEPDLTVEQRIRVEGIVARWHDEDAG